MNNVIRRVKKGLRNLPNLTKGYNIYVDKDKLELITYTFRNIKKNASSFADLGAVWKVNAAYTIFTLKNYKIQKAFVVDTNYNTKTDKKLANFDNIIKIQGNFGTDEVIQKIGQVDVIFFFDVLLHQVNPNWNEILLKYSKVSGCFLIFNQQWVNSQKTFRLTDLPLEKYKETVPLRKDGLFDFIYEHEKEMNEEHNRPWKDIHNIFQWAITDHDLIRTMKDLAFKEVFYKNCGRFSNSKSFENHAFIFVKQ